MASTILGIDGGGYETKIFDGENAYDFISDIGEYRERKLKETFGKDDIVWEYKGMKGFAGTLAKYESEYGGTMKGKTKANFDATLRILIAIYLYGGNNNSIVVGQPIEGHEDSEKDKIKNMLLGEHSLIINNVNKTFCIDKVEVAPEGAVAMLSNPVGGLIRGADIGSGTINFFTLFNMKRIDKGSFTEQLGLESIRTKDLKQYALNIYRIMSAAWGINDTIYLTGGGAQAVYNELATMLPNLKILKPKIGNKIINTKFANSVGMYNVAKGVFANGND